MTGKEGSRHAVGYDVTYRVLREIAERRYENLEGNKLKALSNEFGDVANIVIRAMEERIAAGHTVKSYQQYKRIANDYLIPYFGKLHINNITPISEISRMP